MNDYSFIFQNTAFRFIESKRCELFLKPLKNQTRIRAAETEAV